MRTPPLWWTASTLGYCGLSNVCALTIQGCVTFESAGFQIWQMHVCFKQRTSRQSGACWWSASVSDYWRRCWHFLDSSAPTLVVTSGANVTRWRQPRPSTCSAVSRTSTNWLVRSPLPLLISLLSSCRRVERGRILFVHQQSGCGFLAQQSRSFANEVTCPAPWQGRMWEKSSSHAYLWPPSTMPFPSDMKWDRLCTSASWVVSSFSWAAPPSPWPSADIINLRG